MNGLAYQVAFWVTAVVAVVATSAVVLVKHPLKGAFALVGSFFAIAAAFLMLDARLVAVFQILVYAGAIMVFVIFVIMLINLRPEEMTGRRVAPAKGAAIAIGAAVIAAALLAGLGFAMKAPAVDAGFGQVGSIAGSLYTQFAFAFEALSVLAGKKDFTKE
jgi:NADH-quinone oxidoreductase subunit J